MADNNVLFDFDPVRSASWLVIIATLVAVLVLGSGLLIPLAIALFLWILVGAIRAQLDRLFRGQPLPIWLSNILAVLVMLVASYLMVGIVASQADALRAAIPVYQSNFSALAAATADRLNIGDLPTAETILSQLDLAGILSFLGDSVAALASDIVLICIYLGFLMAEESAFIERTRNLYRAEDEADRVEALLWDVTISVQRYIGMKTAVSLLTGVVSYAVLLGVGVDFAAVWALLIFALNFIPTIGSIIGVVFPSLLALLQFDTITPFLVVALGLGATQFVIGNVIEPAYMGKSLNLSPFMILLSLSFWGIIWGLPGMFLSVPMMVVTGMFCAHVDGLRGIAVILSSDGRPGGSAPESLRR